VCAERAVACGCARCNLLANTQYLACLHCAGRTWPTSFKDHGWYFSVEPFSGMSIQGHKPYQFNHLVQRTDVAYPNLWVANGSASTPLGQALGMDGDFVTGKSRLAGCCLWVACRYTALTNAGHAAWSLTPACARHCPRQPSCAQSRWPTC